MTERLTRTQRYAMSCFDGYEWLSFGEGMGRERVSLRALFLRAPHLIKRRERDGHEEFRLTRAGLEARHD